MKASKPIRALLLLLALVASGGSLALIAPTAVAASSQVFPILVMGDSYSAGNGAGDNFGPDDCWRSHHNYAGLYAAALERAPYNESAPVTNVACSGDTTQGFTSVENGQQPQLDAVNNSYGLIMLSTGGDDLDFADIVQDCLIHKTRDGAKCNHLLHAAETLLSNGTMESRIRQVLTDIHDRANPLATVALLGYPYLESDPSYRLPYGHNQYVAVGKWLRAIENKGDALQQKVVTALDAANRTSQLVFVKTKATFAGHELSALSSNPKRWFVEPITDTLEWETWYHPNPKGWAAEAKLLLSLASIPKHMPTVPISSPPPPVGSGGGSGSGGGGSTGGGNNTGGSAPGTWSTITLPFAPQDHAQLTSMSCPSAQFCVAAYLWGSELYTSAEVSSDPGGGPSQWTSSGDRLEGDAITCASQVSCVASGYGIANRSGTIGYEFSTSTEPGGLESWLPAFNPSEEWGLQGAVSCASDGFCAAASGNGIVTSSDPTGGAGAWTYTPDVDQVGDIVAISCPSQSFCAATDDEGNVLSSSDPAGGGASWQSAHIDEVPALHAGDFKRLIGISCTSSAFCAAIDNYGSLFTSTNPHGGAATWTSEVLASVLDSIACAGSSFCALSTGTQVMTANDLQSGTPQWVSTELRRVQDLSCPTESFCAGIDGEESLALYSNTGA
jgi:hypothetical protein